LSFLKKKAQEWQLKQEQKKQAEQRRNQLRRNLDKQIAEDEDKAYGKAYAKEKIRIANQRAVNQATRDAGGRGLGSRLTMPINSSNMKKTKSAASSALNFLNGDMGFNGGNSKDIFSLGPSNTTTPKVNMDKTVIHSGGQTITIKQTGASIPKQIKTNSIRDNVEKLLEF
jgi:hypothetical protein